MGFFKSIFGQKASAPEPKNDCVIRVIFKGKEITLLLTEQEFIAAAERAVRELDAVPIDDGMDEKDDQSDKSNRKGD